jgi:cytochrome b involved in lipid metabolism
MNRILRYASRSGVKRANGKIMVPAFSTLALQEIGSEGGAGGRGTHKLCGLLAALALATAASGTAACSHHTEPPEAVYRADEVAKHISKATGIWVIYEGGVYDISKFVINHPGGLDKIMLAAGGDIGPFWRLYPQHTKTDLPLKEMAGMRIGVLHEDDLKALEELNKTADQSDPYSTDPATSPLLTYHMRNPPNAEPPTALLTEHWITPEDLHFVRNHHPMPHVKEEEYFLTISGLGLPYGGAGAEKAITFTLKDLKTKFHKHTIVNSIQCGGNRRAGMNDVSKVSYPTLTLLVLLIYIFYYFCSVSFG